MQDVKVYKKLFSYMRKYLWLIVISIVCMFISSAATLIMPWIVKELLNEALTTKNISSLNMIIFISLVVVIVLCSSTYLHEYILNFVSQKVIYRLRNDMFSHMISLPTQFYNEKNYTNLLSRITNDITLLQQFFVGGLSSLLKEPLVLIGGLIFIFFLHWKLALLSLVVGPWIIFSIVEFSKRVKKISFKTQEHLAKIVDIVQESLANIKLVKAFNRDNLQKQMFITENQNYLSTYMRGARILVASAPIVEFLSTLGIIVIIWYGSWQVFSNRLTIPELVAFILYLGSISLPVKRLARINILLAQVKAGIIRIFEVLNEPIQFPIPLLEIKKEKEDINIKKEDIDIKKEDINIKKIEFRKVSFSYDTAPTLQDISFSIESSEVVAIVGPSGGGKTTLAYLLLRLYEPTKGRILINDKDIKDIDLCLLRESIGIVPQEVFLFTGTIKDNIRYGNLSADDEDIEAVLELSNCSEFIKKLPCGIETNIGKMGARLSAGQRQRIAIARAIIKKPKILILDEATSNLDPPSEYFVISALKKIMYNQTTIFITHKLSQALKADKIIVLDKTGKIAEMGRHEKLLTNKNLYYNLWQQAIK